MTKFFILLIVFLITFIIAVTLGIHNDQMVNFSYLLAKGEYRLSSLLSITFGVGFILGWIICFIFYLKIVMKLKITQRKLHKLEQQHGTTPLTAHK